MSVIVLGMAMPQCCLGCDFFAGNGCKRTRTIFPDWMNVADRAKECPLRPLPEKHGRLIDGEISEGVRQKWGFYYDNSLQSLLNDCPTIVEAEGDCDG